MFTVYFHNFQFVDSVQSVLKRFSILYSVCHMSLPCLFPLDPFYHRWNNPPETRASPRHSLTLFPSVAAQGQGYWLSMAQADTITNICQGSLMCMFPTRYLILRGKKIAKYNLYYKRNFNFFPQNSKVIPTSGPQHPLTCSCGWCSLLSASALLLPPQEGLL